MKNLTTKKYLRFIFILLGFFVLSLLLGAFVGCMNESPQPLLGLGIGAVCGAVIFLIPLIYYLINLIALPQKIKQAENKIGRIENWNNGFIRGFGKVSLKIDDTEYFTDTLFTGDEARGLVGKTVRYCIVDETLILLCVVEE